MKILSRTFLVLMFFSFSLSGAQEVIQNNQSDFDEFMDRSGNRYRAASGFPGPEYWQNETDYEIEATLNDEDHSISGKITLTYTNNSPQDLDFIWMHLEQNRFTEDSRGTLTTPIGGNRYNGDVDGGYEISNLEAKVKRSTSSKYLITDTRMQVFFDRPIAANGGKPQFLWTLIIKFLLMGWIEWGAWRWKMVLFTPWRNGFQKPRFLMT